MVQTINFKTFTKLIVSGISNNINRDAIAKKIIINKIYKKIIFIIFLIYCFTMILEYFSIFLI